MTQTENPLVKTLAAMVHGGLTPQDAYKNLCQFIDEAAVKQALIEFERQTGRIRTMGEPPTLITRNLVAPWYMGPAENDPYWTPLRDLILQRGWNEAAITSLDQASTRILSMLPPPGMGQYSTRGLVIGYVQSGKTANFSALIAKAASAGYKFFIVLSGITDNLRTQTQNRLSKELTSLNPSQWFELTTGVSDFSYRTELNVNAFLTDHTHQKVLCVIKKNAPRLRLLLKWLKGASPQVIGSCPILIVDDEADQASVNASNKASGRTAINKVLLDILNTLPRVAYVGYTATPFANVFINPADEKDLYPRDFIVDLPRPSEYFGPESIFGRERLTEDEPERLLDGLDMIRYVPDDKVPFRPEISEIPYLQPTGPSTKDSFEPDITPSLETALNYFYLATAARYARGQASRHSTMLIHTTLYTAVHDKFLPLVTAYQKKFESRLQSGDPVFSRELEALWESEHYWVDSSEFGLAPVSFDALSTHLPAVLARSEVVVDNSRSQARLFYDEITPGVKIVIGGSTLSRGLTLEGLLVSYFVRTSTAYDTVLQMGRWFGYRPGYADLPRIWMTRELEEYFYFLATVEQELRNDVRRYEVEGLTPLEFGVRIRTHPFMEITARAKMQHVVDCDVSYGDRTIQTILFNHTDKNWLDKNISAARGLVGTLAKAGITPVSRLSGSLLFEGAEVATVLDFLDRYSFQEESKALQSTLLLDYIKAQNQLGKLMQWNIGIISRAAGPADRMFEFAPGISVPLLDRARYEVGMPKNYANLKQIISIIDQGIDFNLSSKELRDLKDSGLQIERQRLGIPLLLLYPINRDSLPAGKTPSVKRQPLEAVEDLIGACFMFPPAGKDTPQRYKTVDLSGVTREEEPEIPEDPVEGGSEAA